MTCSAGGSFVTRTMKTFSPVWDGDAAVSGFFLQELKTLFKRRLIVALRNLVTIGCLVTPPDKRRNGCDTTLEIERAGRTPQLCMKRPSGLWFLPGS